MPSNLHIHDELAAAYLKSIYRVFLDDGILEMKINRESLKLKVLLQNINVEHCALVTAYNPVGKKISDEENEIRHQSLRDDIHENWEFLEGDGLDPEAIWKPEKSFFIVDINLDEARELSRKYEQLAFVLTARIGFARLIATDPEEQDKLKTPTLPPNQLTTKSFLH